MQSHPSQSPAKKKPSLARPAALVFLGGACYGFNATCYKFSYAAGFSSAQTAAAQVWFAFFLFAALLAASLATGRRWDRIGALATLKLLGLGCATCATTIFYTFAMSTLPVPLALTLLFQFTWIGTVVQVLMTRRAPAACQVASALVIVAGTVFASGLYATDLSNCNPWGVAAGLAAAVCCALFLALSGRVRPACSQAQRGFVICAGAVVLSHAVCPDFILSGVLLEGIAPFGLVIGALGFFLPVLLFGLGTPHLPAGLSAVLAASELPAGLIVAMVVLGEPIGAVEWAGVFIILLGVCIAQLQLLPCVRRKGQISDSGKCG